MCCGVAPVGHGLVPHGCKIVVMSRSENAFRTFGIREPVWSYVDELVANQSGRTPVSPPTSGCTEHPRNCCAHRAYGRRAPKIFRLSSPDAIRNRCEFSLVTVIMVERVSYRTVDVVMVISVTRKELTRGTVNCCGSQFLPNYACRSCPRLPGVVERERSVWSALDAPAIPLAEDVELAASLIGYPTAVRDTLDESPYIA